MGVIRDLHIVKPGTVGAVRPVDAVHLAVDRDLGASSRQPVPLGVVHGMLRHGGLSASVNEGLAAVSHHNPLPTKQNHILVLEVNGFKVTDTLTF